LANAASFYADLAEKYQPVFEDSLIASLLRKREYKSDAIHFNEQGYRVVAEAIHELLMENGAFKSKACGSNRSSCFIKGGNTLASHI
jgi:hypothetical protein